MILCFLFDRDDWRSATGVMGPGKCCSCCRTRLPACEYLGARQLERHDTRPPDIRALQGQCHVMYNYPGILFLINGNKEGC